LPDGLLSACVKAEAAVDLFGFDVDGLDSCLDAIVATRADVASLFFGLDILFPCPFGRSKMKLTQETNVGHTNY